ncbi:MAG: hypothetical protein AUJ89_02795 [Candidatus Omnitrophica bacterium CG1_02_43_210]|nr:MAG: hypothetical protein AUJ89_02795 [Candidatus Omnitrophica bacterium CG1_02_43_210]
MEQATNIQPTLLFSVLCDDIRREDNGKFILLGLFETIGSRVFPAHHPTIYVMNCWCSGLGSFKQRTRILDTGSNVLVQDEETSFQLTSLKAKHRIIARFNNILLQAPGEYSVEVLSDGDLKVRYPLIVEQINPANQSRYKIGG